MYQMKSNFTAEIKLFWHNL